MDVVCISDATLVRPGEKFNVCGPGTALVSQRMLEQGIYQWPESGFADGATICERDGEYIAALTALDDLRDLPNMAAVVSLHLQGGVLYSRDKTWLWILYRGVPLVSLTHIERAEDGVLLEAHNFLDVASPFRRVTEAAAWNAFFRTKIAETLRELLSKVA